MAKLKSMTLNELEIKIDERISKNIKLFGNNDPSEEVQELFYLASTKLADQFEDEDISDIPVCKCIFVDSDEFTFALEPNEDSCSINFCIFPVHRWSRNGLSKTRMLANIVEQLCDFYWRLKGDVEKSCKVLVIMKRINKRFEMEHYYDVDYIEHLYNLGYKK